MIERVLSNLIENAMNFMPARGKVQLSVKQYDGQLRGSGLGLAISQKIMELHYSSITVTSKLNEGSVFEFDLPCIDHCT